MSGAPGGGPPEGRGRPDRESQEIVATLEAVLGELQQLRQDQAAPQVGGDEVVNTLQSINRELQQLRQDREGLRQQLEGLQPGGGPPGAPAPPGETVDLLQGLLDEMRQLRQGVVQPTPSEAEAAAEAGTEVRTDITRGGERLSLERPDTLAAEDILADLPLEAAEEFIQQQYNFIERVKSWFDIDDDSLAVLIALQLRSQATQQAQLEVLTGETGISVSVDSRALAEAMAQAGGAAMTTSVGGLGASDLLSFPKDGRAFSFPAGTGPGNRHEFNLESGEVDVNGVGTRAIRNSLAGLETDLAHAAQLWADDSVVIRTFDAVDDITGVWELDTGYTAIQAGVIRRMEVDAPRTFNMRAQFSTGAVAPLEAAPVAIYQTRFGHLNTSDGTQLQTIPFIGPNAEDYGENDLPTAADNHGTANIFGGGYGAHRWIVENTAGNDAEVQARVFDEANEQAAADNDIHGSVDTANTNVVTVSANDFAYLESGITGRIFQLLGQAATDTNEVNLEAQYIGTTPMRR